MTENPTPGSDKIKTAAQNPADTAFSGSKDTFASLRIPNFRWLLSGSTVSYIIMWIQNVVLNWLIYDLTGSGTILGTLNLFSSAASFIMIFITPILVDSYNRRTTMLIETTCLFALSVATGSILLTGHVNIALIFAYTFIFGLIQTLDNTLRQVLVFDLLPRPQTPNALAINQTSWSLMRVLGPSIGGFFILWFGAGGSLLVQAGAYVLIAITILQLRVPVRKLETKTNNPMQNIRVGLSFIFQNPVTRISTLIGIIMPILVLPVFIVLPPIYAVKVFDDSSGRILGFLMAATGIGGIIGGVMTTYLRRFGHWGRLQILSVFLLSLTLLGFAYTTSLPLALILLGISGVFEMVFLTTNMTVLQLSIPDKLRARVTSAINLTWILSPIGSLIAGSGADLIGPKMITIVLCLTAIAASVVFYAASPTIRNFHLNQEIKMEQY